MVDPAERTEVRAVSRVEIAVASWVAGMVTTVVRAVVPLCRTDDSAVEASVRTVWASVRAVLSAVLPVDESVVRAVDIWSRREVIVGSAFDSVVDRVPRPVLSAVLSAD